MKRLIFLIFVLIPVVASANYGEAVISDTTYFNFGHTSAIDSAQLILMRGAVSDTFSLMPITGSSHKWVEWEGIFNQVDSAGTYNVWIEPYSSGAIIDTILGTCQVELAARDANIAQISDDATAADNAELFFDNTGFNATNSKIGIVDLVGSLTGSAINAIANYRQYIVKGVVEDSSGNTTVIFQTDLAASTNDIYNRQQIEFISGNNVGAVTQISDYVGASGVITVSPGLVGGGANAGDSFKVTGVLAGLLANIPDSNLVNVSPNAAVYADTVLRPPQSIVAEDTVTTGDTLAVKKDSLIYQGGAAGLTAQEVIDSLLAQTNADTIAASLYAYLVRNVGGGGGSAIDSARIDSLLKSVGWDAHYGGPTYITSLQEKIGDDWLTADPNIFTSLDTINAKLDAIGSGTGNRLCSLFVANASGALSSGTVRMISGGDTYQVNISGDGFAVFNLNDATWLALAYVTFNQQDTIPQTFVVTAAMRDTITMSLFSPTPAPGDLCGVYGWIKDIGDIPIEGAIITFSIDDYYWPVKYENEAIVAHKETESDTAGYWYLPVLPNGFILTGLEDSSSTYRARCTYAGQNIFDHQQVTVPDSSTWLMVPDAD